MFTKVLRQWCIVIQLAKISGFNYIITTTPLKHTEYLKSYGATHVIDRILPLDAFLAALKEIGIEGLPARIEYAYDAIGDVEASFRFALVPGGTRPARFTVEKMNPLHVEYIRALFGAVTGSFGVGCAQGKSHGGAPWGLAGIPEGLKRLEANQVSGLKLVARPDETA
ncbi:hypothetical protein DFP72DRAFT_1067641 [Ephemerocybe angulata]|uniref:Alcohol dehydrogenase-like C-terminal domain-containing protein n=1 Tax=Ephemerocybe angulata TaxID=980116 RepID=A0A8H6HYA6_9AGAR|nr:hypothetical protein DFP72DRAFT_1067641 [Tulosesus angulatus]